MADRFWHILYQSLLNKPVEIAGSFAPNGASALVATSTFGKGFTVARTGVGTFQVSLGTGLVKDVYRKLIGGNCTLQLLTADDKFVQLGAVNLAAGTVVLRIWDSSAAAPADVAADANNRVHFRFLFTISTED